MGRFISLLAAATIVAGPAVAQGEWFPYEAEEVTPAFSADGQVNKVSYIPLERASRPWNICVSFPHMKDAYWLGVDYGVVEEARRLGVNLNVVEAGGYTELNRQISQIEDCVAGGADAVIIGAISLDGLNNLVNELARQDVPVIDVINGISSENVTAKSLVSFRTMGASAGKYLAEKHPAGSEVVQVGWFPGPAGAGWVEAAHASWKPSRGQQSRFWSRAMAILAKRRSNGWWKTCFAPARMCVTSPGRPSPLKRLRGSFVSVGW